MSTDIIDQTLANLTQLSNQYNENNTIAVKAPNKLPKLIEEKNFAEIFIDWESKLRNFDKEELNKYYANCKPSTKAVKDYYYKGEVLKLDNLKKTNSFEVSNIISRFRSSTGRDGITAEFLKSDKSCAKTIADMFNQCVTLSYFPNKLKEDRITPRALPEANLESFEGWESVAVVNNIAKIYEKLLLNRLFPTIKSMWATNNIYAVDDKIMNVIKSIKTSLNSGNDCLLVDVAMKNVLDNIPHRRLLQKLEERYGVSGSALEFIKSYFEHRKHCVEIDNEYSALLEKKVGIQRGTVMCEAFYQYYMNDIVIDTKIRGSLMYNRNHIYIICSDKFPKQLLSNAEEDVQVVLNWIEENALELDQEQSAFLQFKNESIGGLKVKDIRIKKAERSINLMGVQLQSDMKWDVFRADAATKKSKYLSLLEENDTFSEEHRAYIKQRIGDFYEEKVQRIMYQ